ncbi:MAG: formylglycine-generating enzyme family protein [Cyanobacteria bacterium]|nr:formylglycine-generating enzyme family protein [Cyanobacteriota bacterium]MDA0865557.1 formylglycine-generating enzyme family protein [Cyanobacteriota bacterium]
MKRRRFFQYSGLGSLGFLLAARDSALASVLASPSDSPNSGLETFEFRVPTVDRAGTIRRQQTHTAKYFPAAINGAERLEMVEIAPGEFWMGAPKSEANAKGHEFPRHRVSLSPFFLSKYPITQAQWTAVAALPKVKRDLQAAPSHFQGGTLPVESVSWLDAVEFCDRLTQHTGRRYQLPSEAQWEYACRAGTQTPFNTGETITSQLADYMGTATYKAETTGEYRQATVAVGSFSPNAFGLSDMHGNVWEWCADSWQRSYQGASTDGRARGSLNRRQAQLRAIRGGGWLDTPTQIRSASRSGYVETALNRTIGFRVMTT